MKKIATTVLTIVLILGMTVPANADLVSSEKVTEKIDSRLQTLLKDADSDKRIPVDIWLYDTSTVEEREQKIFSKLGLNKAKIALDTRNAVSAEKIDEYIVTERELYAAEREQEYVALRLEYADVTALQTTRKTDTRLFYSQYAPMISAELTSAEIKLLARDSRVESICYSPNVILQDAGDISVPAIGANYTRDTLGYTGAGVKIGMIETSLPQSFISENIRYDETLGDEAIYLDHSNRVASILVGKTTTVDGVTYEGIVPNAELYATCASNSVDWYPRVEWLLSQGVHVINMSAGFAAGAYYTDMERWVDYVIANHHVHFVTAAGNTGLGVSSPGMAYNVLTVGAIDDKNNMDESDDVICATSSFDENNSLFVEGWVTPTNKPDLVAPGFDINTPINNNAPVEERSGTSFAAPHVTAVVAQLCQRFPSLRVLQAGVKAILTASISHSEHAYTPADEEYDMFGAGVVNARAAMETANAYRMVDNSFPANSPANAEKVYTFSAPADQRIRVSLTWLKHATLPEDQEYENYNLADLDLYVIHPEGADIEYSTEIYNNTEIVDFVAPVAGTYQMVVSNRLASQQKIEFGLSWWFGEIVDSD